MAHHRLDPAEARRIAVRAQLLTAQRPTGVLEVVQQLSLLQIDPTAAIAPNADLVLWTRLGSGYRPETLQQALERDRSLFELRAMIRPIGDLHLYRPMMAAAPFYEAARTWLADNDRFRGDVVERLRQAGPLLSRDIADTSQTPWPSSGWTNDRNVTQMLETLSSCGEVAVFGRVGRQRLWHVAEAVYPAENAPRLSEQEALLLRDERRLASLGIVNDKAIDTSGERGQVGEAGDAAIVEGVAGTWRVDPSAIGLPFAGRTALLSPFDRLVHNRERLTALFDFEYTLEMYKPAAKRRWGYFALQILHSDALVGKVDARVDRKAGTLNVAAIHQDVVFTDEIEAGVLAELGDLALWLGVELAGPGLAAVGGR